jgi:hypothetical protein
MDASGALRSIKDLDGAINQAAGTTAKAGASGGPFSSLFSQFTAGVLVASALQKGIAFLKDTVSDAIKGAIEEEKAENSLRAALEITGRTVQGNIQHYMAFAMAQMKVTTYTHEEVRASQALLLQLTSLNQNGIDRATRGAMGLASTMGMDLHSATMMVTKAMEGNYTELGRVGIRVSENMTAEQKMASILDQTEKLYGRATAEAETFGGSLKALVTNWHEIKEAAGAAIIQTEGLGSAIRELNKAMAGFVSSGAFSTFLKQIEMASPAFRNFTDGIKMVTLALALQTAKAEHASKVNAGLVIAAGALGDTFAKAAPMVKVFGIDFGALVGMFTSAPTKINQTGTAVHNLTAEQIKAAAEAKKLRTEMEKAATSILDKYFPLQGMLRKVREEEDALTRAFKAGIINEAQYKAGMSAINMEFFNFTATADKVVIPAIEDIGATANKTQAQIRAGLNVTTKAWDGSAKAWVTKNQDAIRQIFSDTSSVIGQINTLMQQSTTNKLILMDQEYQARLDGIKNSLMSEEEKNKAIEGLEAEYSMKRRQLQHQAAVSQKAIAIATAMISMGEAIAKAFTAGPIIGQVLAGITAALIAVQIARMRATPIPLAQGAIFKSPARLMSQAGNEYEVAEAGEAEIVSSPSRLREAIMGNKQGSAERRTYLTIPIYLGTKLIKQEVITIVEEAGQLGRLRIVGKAVV